MKNKNTKGFTLMELTIVLAILAIIAAILVPMFLTTTDRARLRSDIQSARVIQNAMDLYRVERGQAVAGGSNIDTVMTNLATAGYLNLRNATIQTEGAVWAIDDTRGVVVDIGGINVSDSVRTTVYRNLSPAERLMVRGGIPAGTGG